MSESGVTGTNWKTITNDQQLKDELGSAAKDKLIVIYFHMPTCPHCLRMTPVAKRLSLDYPKVDFLYTDVHQADEAIENYKLQYTPTFILILGGKVVDRVDGEEPQKLEQTVKNWNSKSGGARGAAGRRSSANLEEYFDKDKIDLRNCRVGVPLYEGLLADQELPGALTRVESENDGPILLRVAFNEDVLVESLNIRVPAVFGPRTLHLYANHSWSGQPNFDNLLPDESVTIKPNTSSADVEEHQIKLNRLSKIPVQSITVKALSDQPDYAFTVVERLIFIGRPANP